MRAVRACLCAAAVAVTAALPARALGAGPSFAEKEAARTTAGKGYEAFEAGQYPRAIELFRQADKSVHAPPHWLYIARSQVKLGMLLEAEGTYRQIVDEQLAADAPAPFKEAHASAKSELAELGASIPSLSVKITGELASTGKVSVDGEALGPEDLGRPLRKNPGTHTVRLDAPGKPPQERSVTLKGGGGEERIVFSLDKPPPSVVPPVLAFSLGAVGVGVGTAAAILSIHAAPASVNKLRVAEIVGFAAGGAGIVTGIVLVALRPKAPPAAVSGAPAPARVRVGLGLGGASVAGEF
jgi:hypothetical protein